MKTTKLLLLLTISSIMVMQSCKKNKACEVVQAAPQDFLDYWYFGDNSYWVYQKVGTNEIDTLKVFGKHEKFYAPCVATEALVSCINYYDYNMIHTHEDFFSDTFRLEHWFSGETDPVNGWEMRIRNRYKGGSGINAIIPDNPTSNVLRDGVTIEDTITYISSNYSLPNTVVINANAHGSGRFFLSPIYFAPKVGIVEFGHNRDNTWQLIDYKH